MFEKNQDTNRLRVRHTLIWGGRALLNEPWLCIMCSRCLLIEKHQAANQQHNFLGNTSGKETQRERNERSQLAFSGGCSFSVVSLV